LSIGNSVVSVYFSPKDSIIQKVIVPLVDGAKKQILIPVFLITDKRLAQALINAKERGVDIKVIVDATNARGKYSKHRLLRQHGILVKTETFAGKLHSKTMIIDNTYSVIGSMNFSKSGETKNDENVLVIKNTKLAIFNRIFFEYLWKKIDNYWLTHDANSEGLDSVGSCSDGIDNDYDGKTDMEDEGCRIYRGKYVTKLAK
jgi:phosphatidylserine/phosphatidylglycerophosphate/cardiolipin synthase-like enzyme